ncbi:MAG: TIGR03790 family protein [Bryobacteraceae bacterium]
MRLLVSLALAFTSFGVASAQNPLASRVLVVYVDGDPGSQSVASHYVNARGIPPSNLCPVSLPNPGATALNGTDYDAYLKRPVQSCLQAVGAANILYIVLAYVRPYAVNPGSGLNNYALDSYLADVWDQYARRAFNPAPSKEHPYYADSQSQGNVFPPFQSLAQFRDIQPQPLIYSVWRLDGASPIAAMSLVDNAVAAESAGGPISNNAGSLANACLDLEIDPINSPDSGYRAADWDLQRAADFLNWTGRFQTVRDANGEVFGTAPAPLCPNTALYAGWYNYGRYNDVFSWDVGAIGWDLDSGALADPRGGVWWGSNALQHGITVTSGPMNEPYLEGMARPGGTIRDLLEGANVGDAFLRNTRWLKWMILNVGDPLYTPFAAKVAPFDTNFPSNSLSLAPRQLIGGQKQVEAVLTVAIPAPPDGLTVNLLSENDALAIPQSVTIASGETRVTFPISTAVVTSPLDVRVTASSPSFQVTNTASLYPLLAGITLTPDSVGAGGTVSGTVVLNDAAPPDGVTVQLVSDRPDVAGVAADLFIPGDRTKGKFTVTTSAGLTHPATINITASYAGAQATATLTVTP